MKIFVAGTRGIPDIPGGVERHCQELYPRIVRRNHEVILCTRKPYVTNYSDEWRGVRLIHCFAPRIKSLEAVVHTLIAVLKARFYSPDVMHIHAVGPALLVPLARLLGLKVVVTNHGPDYDRQKWGKLAKIVLKAGEKFGCTFANEVIVISRVIERIVQQRCNRKSTVILNGVPIPAKSSGTDFLKSKGIVPGNYVLSVARFVPEKGLHDLICAFRSLKTTHQLVIAGEADHETDYSKRVRTLAAEDRRIILPGYITGEKLNQVFSHAALFILPSYHEGLPIALLEAMSYGLSVLASDIPANREVMLHAERYFRPGDVEELAGKLEAFLERGITEQEQEQISAYIHRRYNWDDIAKQTIKVYQRVTKRG